MSAHELLSWARAHSGLISVAGALILFFSWVVTNTLGQRYSQAKAAIESAQATFRLYTTLHEQRNQLNSLAMEVIQRREPGLNASALSPGRTGDATVDEARTEYSLTRLAAHQVRELMDFTAEAHALSRAVGKPSSTSREIESVLKEVGEIQATLLQHEREAETAINSSNLQPDELTRVVESYSQHFRSEALPRVPELYQRVVTASNARKAEASQYLESTRTQAERAGTLSILLYLIGSCLALSGQAIEKAKPKDESIQQQRDVSERPHGDAPKVPT